VPAHHSHRFPSDLDLPMRFLQVDCSRYENYWLTESPPQSAGMVSRNLPKIVSWLRLVCDRVASVLGAVLAIVLGPRKLVGHS
jgi:nitric oxide reductase large subunit